MSLSLILKSEFMKYKRSHLYEIIFITPILSFVMLFADLHIRFDWLTSGARLEQSRQIGIYNKLGALLYESHFGTLWFTFLSIIIVLVSVIVNYAEYSENTWKQILSRPIDRWKVYFSKWMVIFIFTFVSILMNIIGLIILKHLFKVDGDYNLILKYLIFEIASALGVISIQQFISCYIKNSLVAAGVGFAGTMGAYMMAQNKVLGSIFPYSCILRAVPLGDGKDAQMAAIFGVVSCVLWIIIGILEFENREV